MDCIGVKLFDVSSSYSSFSFERERDHIFKKPLLMAHNLNFHWDLFLCFVEVVEIFSSECFFFRRLQHNRRQTRTTSSTSFYGKCLNFLIYYQFGLKTFFFPFASWNFGFFSPSRTYWLNILMKSHENFLNSVGENNVWKVMFSDKTKQQKNALHYLASPCHNFACRIFE